MTAKERLVSNERDYHEAQHYFEEENADVEKLEAQSLTSFLYNLIGTYERKLDKEKKERVEAKVALDRTAALYLEAREEFTGLTDRITRVQQELTRLKSTLIHSDPAFQDKVSQEKRKRFEWLEEIREVDEAVEAGKNVLSGLDTALDKLQSANSMATWDLFTDSLLVDMVKYSHIDKAEKELAFLEALIDRYRKELKDVDLEGILNYEQLGNMRRFFDVFFDNIFSDWDTKDTINRNMDMLEDVYDEVLSVQKKLTRRKSDLKRQVEESSFYY
ncbi:MAG: hypothetical protein JJU16_01855 [Alkalibacterium sp.]|nr:hypothetical protein [Alkalibacterium sp.]